MNVKFTLCKDDFKSEKDGYHLDVWNDIVETLKERGYEMLDRDMIDIRITDIH